MIDEFENKAITPQFPSCDSRLKSSHTSSTSKLVATQPTTSSFFFFWCCFRFIQINTRYTTRWVAFPLPSPPSEWTLETSLKSYQPYRCGTHFSQAPGPEKR
jgi:hypothetical protein